MLRRWQELADQGPSTLTRTSPSPTRKTMASLGSVPGFPSRWTTPLGMRTKSPGPPSTLSVPPGPNSSRQAPLGLEHIGVVARVDVPAGPGAGVGSGPAGPDVVVGERLATVHPGRLGSRTMKPIGSDQDGSVHGGPAFGSGMRSSVVRRAMWDKVLPFSGSPARVRTHRRRCGLVMGGPSLALTARRAAVAGSAAPVVTQCGPRRAVRRGHWVQAGHLILMGGCERCAAGGRLWCQESCASGDAG